MKKLYRRSISGLMALLICFTTILGGGITAFARFLLPGRNVGQKIPYFRFGFPRSGAA